MLPMQCIAYCIYMDKLSGLSTVLSLSSIALTTIRLIKLMGGFAFQDGDFLRFTVISVKNLHAHTTYRS